MDFIFSAEQDQLRAAVRSVLDDAVADGIVRAAVDGDPLATDPATRELWGRMVELGWAGMLVDEAHGGLGLGLVDAVVVLEELGRVTAPGPFLSSAVGATAAARLLGLDDLLADLATGGRVGVLALDYRGRVGAFAVQQGFSYAVADGARNELRASGAALELDGSISRAMRVKGEG